MSLFILLNTRHRTFPSDPGSVLKGSLQQHLNEQHQGYGRIIDNRTTEYYDALEAKTKANFPVQSSAIAKYIGGQKEALGFQDASDHEDDNPQDGRKVAVCMECSNAISINYPSHLAKHSAAHLAIRPWKCSVCSHTAKLKNHLQKHLNEQHQGNGRVIDNRTAEYYDALKAKTQTNFPDRARAIAKHIGGQKYGLVIQGGSDDEDDTPEDNRPIVHLRAADDKSLDVRQNVQKSTEAASSGADRVKQEVVPDAVPPRSKEKSTHPTMADTQREVKQELLDVENYSFDFDVVMDGSEADAHADAHAPSRHQNEQNVRNENLHKIAADSPQPYLESLAWTLVNLTTLHGVRRSLADKAELLDSIYAIARQDANKRIKESGVDVLRNLCFDEALHDKLLDDKDHFLVALLTPLADEQDALDDEEIEKLPLALQYYEGSRESVPEIRQKLVEALYQLCSTKHGRCSLRKKGAYALLRELDKATSEKPDPNAPPPKMRPPTLLAQEEHTLHALIGILIRYEEDLGIDTEAVHSLKQLE
ncbi:unnamed protein product, partial [Mesorhabditis spiculigera]